jgi:hypothetical protein
MPSTKCWPKVLSRAKNANLAKISFVEPSAAQ